MTTLPNAVFATERCPSSTSSKYSFIPTDTILEAMGQEGWEVYSASAKKVRDRSREGYQTHAVQLTNNRLSAIAPDATSGLRDRFSIHCRFSHDTSSAIHIMGGMIVAACSNGLIAAEGEIATHRFVHRTLSLDNVMEAVNHLSTQLPILEERVYRWKNIKLEFQQQLELAHAASRLRWADGMPGAASKNDRDSFESLLCKRRSADSSNSLWHTFNRIQENLIKGGGQYVARTNPNTAWRRPKWTTRRIREVKGVDQSIGLNKDLWALGMRLERNEPLIPAEIVTAE